MMGPYMRLFSYLLSQQASQFGGLRSPSTRFILVGSAGPAITPAFSKDPDSIILSEIVEFAYSLSTPQKGQEPFPGLPHLQPYRLIRAHQLAELGHAQLATRYAGLSHTLNAKLIRIQVLRRNRRLTQSGLYLLHSYIHRIIGGTIRPFDRCSFFGQAWFMDRRKSQQTKPRQGRGVAGWAAHEVHRWRRGLFAHGSAEAWTRAGAILALQFYLDDGPTIIPPESTCDHSEPLLFCCTAEDWVRNGNEDDDWYPPHPYQ